MKRKSVLMMLIMVCIISLSALSYAAVRDYSADIVSSTPQGAFQGRMYVTESKFRMEMPQAVTITRADKKVVWLMMPQQGMYIEQPFDPEQAIVSGAVESQEIERKNLGRDTIGDRQVDKFQVTYGHEGVQTSIYEWVDPSLKMPVKVAALDGSWSMEYRNIKIGPQGSSLFEVPAGYKKFEMPSMPGPSFSQ